MRHHRHARPDLPLLPLTEHLYDLLPVLLIGLAAGVAALLCLRASTLRWKR